jgi:hypothetical protein
MKRILILYFFLFCSCSENKEVQFENDIVESSYENSEIISNYEDGTYCAEIEYYNPRTGTNSIYTLTVELEDGRLVNINWPNGGWLDESHYSGVEISDSGEAYFESDRGYQFTLQIISSGACEFDSDLNNEEEEEENIEDDSEEDEEQEEDDQKL